MAEAHPMLRRWHALSRADRKAILARLGTDQRQGLMAMIDAGNRKIDLRSKAVETADDWALFSPPLAQMLRALEAGSDSPVQGMTPAAGAQLLAVAREMRDKNVEPMGWPKRFIERGRQWVKDLDL